MAHGERPSFPGVNAQAARMRLKSYGMTVHQLERWGTADHVWHAATDKGERWITWDGQRWLCSKVAPPNPERADNR